MDESVEFAIMCSTVWLRRPPVVKLAFAVLVSQSQRTPVRMCAMESHRDEGCPRGITEVVVDRSCREAGRICRYLEVPRIRRWFIREVR